MSFIIFLRIMNNNRNLSIVVSFIGEIARRTACSEVGFFQVQDLVDVIHRVEDEFPFLRTTDYKVEVNAKHVIRNRVLNNGDKVEIRLGESVN